VHADFAHALETAGAPETHRIARRAGTNVRALRSALPVRVGQCRIDVPLWTPP
jgi:hypothetical protein